MAITDTDFAAANQRGAAKKAAFPEALNVRYDKRAARVVITLASGLQIAFFPRDVQGLEKAHPEELADAVISPSGLGVHFPQLDVDLDIPALLEGFLGSKRWMAAQIGRAGGKTSSEAKAVAARKNGQRGGRPKKVSGLLPI
ncbi:DUF2442 domain-containing protein [Actimicrobium sp. CCC2.4]|jgi:hypothetical protein|uniref:DUF2442 domain-containing protein n=1 Tax=Actimicrobium sp. CCC2.4 TaxID=3048606 RepID=UPI000204B6D2|nr:DUF2442 domain-containing protein [Actimicrobium sp. CCC2.4]EGF33117.1 hypothetical protein IMCC9480_1156 [Oxalobacteraceae bacterium IMCC9480]MEB0137114.1 DUF2442 domain-containing protein [Actimicrobium sp. CCC2.4]NDP59132.1 DUF2442 domain-containing protein [Oxalobacteraceae bacterium]WPX33697.1 DUF2442 domain-containing protein [Actimicrobium sp. CCC2.4]